MAIKYRQLGRHGVLVSNLCLGTMNFGWHTSEEESFRIMDRALELGINFFGLLNNALYNFWSAVISFRSIFENQADLFQLKQRGDYTTGIGR